MESKMKKILKSLKMNESQISQALGALVVVVIGVLLFNYFKSSKPTPEITDEAEQTVAALENVELTTDETGKYIPIGLPTTHLVAKGEHLWGISEKYFGNGYNWVDIAEINKLDDPGMLVEGMVVVIPKVALRYDKEVVETQAMMESADLLEATSYTVVKGDSLWNISLRAYADGYKWMDVYEANMDIISDPSIIEAGMEIVLPR
jgi:nucleoid-associated protein YgaU